MPSFSHGSRAKLYVNGYDLTAYLKEVTAEDSNDPADTSALGDASKKFISGLREATVSGEGMHDATAGAISPVMQAALGVDNSQITYAANGDAIGSNAVSLDGQETTFTLASPVDDVVSASFEASSDVALGPGVMLRAGATSTSAAPALSTSVDNGAATTAGAAGYVHVLTNSGGTLQPIIQHSVDNSAWVDLLLFTVTTTAGTAERKITAAGATVNRYVRANISNINSATHRIAVFLTRTPTNL